MIKKIDYVALIKDRLNILDIIGKYQKLIKVGSNYKSLCPFHNEKTPSFTINSQKQSYVCYGCGRSGDIFSYIMEKYKISFTEAMELLAAEANIEFNIKLNSQSSRSKKEIQNYYNIMTHIASYYNSNLKEYLKNNDINFLEKKKISLDKIDKYYLGLSNNSHSLENYLEKKSINIDYLLENNIFKINKFGKRYDLFTNRIIFPIKDKYENIIAFGGRSLGEEQPKYINSWENSFFKKREILYNLPTLNKIKNRSDDIYIVEGYTDVIAMESIGLKAVAPLGTALTIEHLKLVWRAANEPNLLMDGDLAGFNASMRALEIILPELGPENTMNFIFLKGGKDPDDIINDADSENSFFDYIKNKKTFLETLVMFCGNREELNTPERIIVFKNKIFEKIKVIKDIDTKKLYRSFALNRVSELSKNQINKFGNITKNIKKDSYFTSQIKNKKIDTFIIRRERSILAAMINNLKLLKQNDEALAKVYLSNSELEKLRNTIIDILSTENILKSEDLKKSLLAKGYESLLKRHFNTKDCIKFDLVEEYAKEESDIKYATETLLNIISIQEKWHISKNKTL